MPGLSDAETAEAFIAACRAELAALKPGNVHQHAGGHGMEAQHFEDSAIAAAPWIASPHMKVGERILRAVEASMDAAGCNTNLGILLLSAPLAVAAQHDTTARLRDRVGHVLAQLDASDAANVFAAIRRASPGGLGRVADQDVAAPPSVSLREAMALAADRDRIARAYGTDFEEVFAFGVPTLERFAVATSEPSFAITALHMAFLAKAPDSHIARKFDLATAENVCREAGALQDLWEPVAGPQSLPGLTAFDQELKERGLNPGTTADLVVATLFAATICDRLAHLGPP
jgi:triphosphoribosyl-dephospho-CoA synthase